MSGNCRCHINNLKSWINKDPDDPKHSKSMRRNIIYFRRMVIQTPAWVNWDKVNEIYKSSKKLREAGNNTVVDHIVPLSSPRVCGLHCEDNLQIIHHLENQKKSNSYWPDMWNEQLSLFEEN